jgi:hypothetical protein
MYDFEEMVFFVLITSSGDSLFVQDGMHAKSGGVTIER